ncbi:MAG TPA: glutathione S-transferase [Burkholderiaceae bacterium]|nr:glutathione S-transferase [Burkholderiaceae bacterium]
MQLIGMLDSPYVRRVAVSLQLLGLAFEHQSISVFRGIPQFKAINPVVKAPTLVCDDGTVLMDSTLIVDYAEALAAMNVPAKTLMPRGLAERQHALRVIGLALAACEKSVQLVYERNVRPPEKLHQPWVERVTGQLRAACDALEAELARQPLATTSATIDQAGVTAAVTWKFIRETTPKDAAIEAYPRLQAHSAVAEGLTEFAAAPHGDGVYRGRG